MKNIMECVAELGLLFLFGMVLLAKLAKETKTTEPKVSAKAKKIVRWLLPPTIFFCLATVLWIIFS